MVFPSILSSTLLFSHFICFFPLGAHPRPEPEISLQMVLNLTLVNLQFSNYAVVQKQQGLSRKHPANSERESFPGLALPIGILCYHVGQSQTFSSPSQPQITKWNGPHSAMSQLLHYNFLQARCINRVLGYSVSIANEFMGVRHLTSWEASIFDDDFKVNSELLDTYYFLDASESHVYSRCRSIH